MLRFVGPLIVCSLNARKHSGDCTGRRDAITLRKRGIANGLPLDFFVRVIWQESHFNPMAVSSKGAQGIAQFMPRTADWRARQSHMHINFGLFADILRELAATVGRIPKDDVLHRDQLAKAVAELHTGLTKV